MAAVFLDDQVLAEDEWRGAVLARAKCTRSAALTALPVAEVQTWQLRPR